jgi:AcrR family transcriptional regulator
MRGEVTRRLILDAAAEAFAEVGYANVALSDIIARAQVTKGACYHHFPTKDALAVALIAYTDAELFGKAGHVTSESASALENLIRVTFALANVTQHDTKVRMGVLLGAALGQTRNAVSEGYQQRRAIFVGAAVRAVAEGDLVVDGLDAADLGEVIWSSFVGNYLVTAAAGQDLVLGLARVWRVILRGIVSAQSASFFEQLVERVAAQYIGKPNGGNRADETNEKLQTALSSRVVIGQATGILAERGNIDMASALALLKSSARSTGERLADVAGKIVAGAAIVIIDARSLAAGSKDPWDVPTGADPPPGGVGGGGSTSRD